MSLRPPATARARIARAVGTCFGLGLLRPGPGTWASAATTAAVVGIATCGGPWPVVAFGLAVTGLGLWVVGNLPGFSDNSDPGEVVIDELAGQTLALLPVVFGAAGAGAAPWQLWPGWLAAFLLFRLFDIWKPWIIGRADRNGGALGLMADDLLAGAAAAAVLGFLAFLWHGVLWR